MKLKLRLSVILTLCSVGVAVAQESTPVPVRTAMPIRATQGSAYVVPGRTEPFESATIYTRATGIIRERRYDIGASVKAGEILAVVDAPEIDRGVDAAKANVDLAKAREANAQSLYNRSDKLMKSNAISEEETEQRLTTTVEAGAAVRVAEAELARLETQQQFASVSAPFDGVISGRNFDRGDHVRGDDAPTDGWLYQLNRIDTLRFVVSASPDLALRLGKETEGIVRFREFPGKEFSGKVAQTSRIFENGSGTMRVELVLDNKDLLLPAGLSGAVQFKLNPAEGTFIVPSNALVLKGGKSTLAAVTEGKVSFVEVLPGRNLGKDTEVTSAKLTETLPVILNPNAMLKAGDTVTTTPLAGKP